MLILGNLRLFELGMEVLIILLTFSMVICFYRLIVGPDVPNRTVAFDLIAGPCRGHLRPLCRAQWIAPAAGRGSGHCGVGLLGHGHVRPLFGTGWHKRY